ncbi:hypothetical protein NDR87_17695 [Nocardia sp. CDC159]|uniref:Uncharacterized protein n=1 Tax=Nocardia pulmonis TaxID=2951408 RepID=A0A9X2E7R7_9NOCA|nr:MULTISPECIES: hypothetical protein [Nocardia]MCM6775829.1 hypothetical protein [Nocardia pulmonis]MCM6788195.1 hypothetical protein [Nocardia sp. CDC159]
MRPLRALSGIVAGGLAALTLVVIGAEILGARRDFPGPGAATVAWHIGLSAVAVAAQIFADRRRGFAAISGVVVVFGAAGYLLVTQWWN